jgi:hypothetical protein
MMLTYPFPSSLNREPAFRLHPTPVNLHLSIPPVFNSLEKFEICMREINAT